MLFYHQVSDTTSQSHLSYLFGQRKSVGPCTERSGEFAAKSALFPAIVPLYFQKKMATFSIEMASPIYGEN